jgi:enterobactin synthetase component D
MNVAPGKPGLTFTSLGLDFGPGVAAVAVVLESPAATISALANLVVEEPPARAVDKRKAEFLAGRYVAHLALSEFLEGGTIQAKDDRAPQWPDGVVGSITHGAGIAAAVVAAGRTHRGLGLDIEALIAPGKHAGIASQVARAAELTHLARKLPGTAQNVMTTLLFSAKESLFKGLYPLVNSFFGFKDVELSEISPKDEASGVLRLALVRGLAPEFPATATHDVQYRLEATRVVTYLALTRGV